MCVSCEEPLVCLRFFNIALKTGQEGTNILLRALLPLGVALGRTTNSMVGERISPGFFGTSEKNMDCGEEYPWEALRDAQFPLNPLPRKRFVPGCRRGGNGLSPIWPVSQLPC
jgi:hypothetical protein